MKTNFDLQSLELRQSEILQLLRLVAEKRDHFLNRQGMTWQESTEYYNNHLEDVRLQDELHEIGALKAQIKKRISKAN